MDIWDKYELDSEVIDKFYDRINNKNYAKVLEELYEFIKNISSNYYKNGEILRHYYFLKTELILVEKKIKDVKEFEVKIRYNDLDKDNFIEYIIFKTRRLILKKRCLYTSSDELNQGILNSLDFSNECHMCSQYIKKICDDNNIEAYILPIFPGYCEDAMLYDGNGYHFANVIKYNNKYYLVDTTYSQFFYANRNNLSRLGIMGTGGCSTGVFMLMSDEGKNISKKIIQDGYIELTEDVFKKYLDAFTISFRNGLYYEDTNDFSYKANYSIDDYIYFLKGEDNQLNYENKKWLGYQRSPLKNKNLCFKKLF